ncbi:MAG: sterol desaturase family protein [Nitrospinae bacterium]|nr:sterol desaturase family protein [Nitrospinota bacterium]
MAWEAAVRLSFFFGVFGAVAMWELAAPRRALTTPKAARWLSNLGLVALNTLLLRLIFPAAAVGLAFTVQDRAWGLLNNVDLPFWIETLGAVVFLDMAIYFQHVLFHAAPSLWRLHRMHHADLDYDVTTGARFHPIEIILSMLIKFGVVTAIGASPGSVLIFEVLLNATAMFNHGNIRIPERVDAVLRLFVVTPDMHRVHHSVEPREANSNFGFNLPWWDRLFGTYLPQPAKGHLGMVIGIKEFRGPRDNRLDRMLIQPFVSPGSGYAINR